MVFMIYKTGVTNGCFNLIHQNARSYPSVEVWTKAIGLRMILDIIISLKRVDQMRDLGVLIDLPFPITYKIKLIKHMQCSG